jgi:hypothetical protein
MISVTQRATASFFRLIGLRMQSIVAPLYVKTPGSGRL